MEQIFVTQNEDEWIIETEAEVLGRYSDRVQAIGAAIDIAKNECKAGHHSRVMAKSKGRVFRTIWIAGKDLYPNAIGKPKSIRTRGCYRLP